MSSYENLTFFLYSFCTIFILSYLRVLFPVSSLAPNSTLLGASPRDAALVDQWVAFAHTELLAPGQLVGQLIRGRLTPYSRPVRFPYSVDRKYVIEITYRSTPLSLMLLCVH